MEEQVGMMAYNEAYKQSIEVADDLYQESSVLENNAGQQSSLEEPGENPA